MKAGFFMFMTGLVVTMAGVGGVENSIENSELLSALSAAVAGLGLMWAGVTMVKRSEQ